MPDCVSESEGRAPVQESFGVAASPPGCQPSASAASADAPASSRSGIPNAVIYAVRLDAEAVKRAALEEAAKIAEGFIGAAKRGRIARGWKMSRFQPHERDEIAAEENGGNIVAREIADALRAASGIVAATAGETRQGLDERSEQSPAPEGGDAPC